MTSDRPSTEPEEPIRISPALIQAAQLQVTLNDRRGLPTDPAIRELAKRRS